MSDASIVDVVTTPVAAPVAVEKKAPATIAVGDKGLALSTFDEYWRFAVTVVKAGLNPKTLDTAEKVFLAIQAGAEVGLPPFASIQNIAVINGRAAIWGDAQLGICQARGIVEDFKEEIIGEVGKDTFGYRCTTKRKGVANIYTQEFTIAKAVTAGLWNKQGPWQQYPDRMLQLKARSFCLRDAYPDALKGLLSVEEVQDTPVEPKNVTRSLAEEVAS